MHAKPKSANHVRLKFEGILNKIQSRTPKIQKPHSLETRSRVYLKYRATPNKIKNRASSKGKAKFI